MWKRAVEYFLRDVVHRIAAGRNVGAGGGRLSNRPIKIIVPY